MIIRGKSTNSRERIVIAWHYANGSEANPGASPKDLRRNPVRNCRKPVKHGLRAEAITLPNESTAAVEARIRDWDEYYRPDSPAAVHLVNQCVQATLMAERCQRYHAAV